MDIFNLASALFGSSRVEETDGISNTVDSISAVGATDSESGNVGLTMDADVTPADDVEGDETIFEVPTSPAVAAGDDVVMGLTGNGPLKVPIVLANPGSGDRQQAQINNAVDLAEQAEAVAQATGQYFWSDTDGAHVTQVTKDDWNDSTSPNYHSGPNSLWNSLGMLFRDGLNNLMAILTNGIAIYDGLGNADSNILAKFYAYATGTRDAARIDFFDGNGYIDYNGDYPNEFTISARNDSTESVAMNTARIRLYQSTDNSVSNVEILAGSNYNMARPAFIQLDSRNTGESSVYVYADKVYLGYYGDSGSAEVSMPQVIATFDQRWRTLGTAGSGGTTFTLPHTGTWLLVTGHNSTAGSNSVWIVRTGGNNAFKMGGGANITVTVSGRSVTVKSTGGTVGVYTSYIEG